MKIKSLPFFSCKNSIFDDRFVSEKQNTRMILSAKIMTCHQTKFFKLSPTGISLKQ
ncbi:hypothetical protein GCWU000282_02570 [Catonella morbi ATCC 51271]|uniref:Uncharacterized protein n=1 Tax=Catonella morbi ATCC 51271 TaxID=592026 RepID=V2XJT6_9FIRM|nr:hypothetical protein GCWU000282_02570 [Catonella morbi ATCC 51271]